MQVLVAGASGAIGSALVPALAAAGHEVSAGGRHRDSLLAAVGSCTDRIAVLDVESGAGLPTALSGVEVAYYLVHSMERTSAGSDFAARELHSAGNFAAACRAAGVRRTIYLGGLVPPSAPSRHLASRLAVEEALASGAPESVALRASIVIAAASRSFRLLVHLVERMPLLALPAWQRYRTQPIDGRDVTAMLVSAATAPDLPSKLDIAGPDIVTYGEILREIADLMMVARPAVTLPVNLTQYTARIAAAISGEQPELVLPLMEGLEGDLLARDDGAPRLLGVSLHSFRAAVERALGDWEAIEPLAAR
jgi:uncharacterized protein YbjT (DUF2867 family)